MPKEREHKYPGENKAPRADETVEPKPMTGEGDSTGEDGIVGGLSPLTEVEKPDTGLSSTTGRIGGTGHSVTGALGLVGSDATTRGPGDEIEVEGEGHIEASEGTTPAHSDED